MAWVSKYAELIGNKKSEPVSALLNFQRIVTDWNIMISSALLSSGVVEIIDKWVESMEYSSRADFILHAVRHTVYIYAKELKFIAEGELHHVLNEKTIELTYLSLTSIFLKKYGGYSGQSVQVKYNAPEGLMNRVRPLLRMTYGFKKKSDFIKVSVMCLLSTMDEVEGIANDVTSYVVKQKENQKQAIHAILENLELTTNPEKFVGMVWDMMDHK